MSSHRLSRRSLRTRAGQAPPEEPDVAPGPPPPRQGKGAPLPDPPMQVYVKFMDSVREYLGSRYGGAWIETGDEGKRSFMIAVVGPTDADRSKISSLAGKYFRSVVVVGVKYSRDELLGWHQEVSHAVMGKPRPQGTSTLLATGKGFYVFAGIGWDPKQNKVIVWTSGRYTPADAVDSAPLVAEIPGSVPADAYLIDTSRVVAIAPVKAPDAPRAGG